MSVDPQRARDLLHLLESLLHSAGAPVPEVEAASKSLAPFAKSSALERAIVADALATVERSPALPSADKVRIYLRPGRRYTGVFWTYASSPENLGSILHFVEQETGRVFRAKSSTKVGAPTDRTLVVAGAAEPAVVAAKPDAVTEALPGGSRRLGVVRPTPTREQHPDLTLKGMAPGQQVSIDGEVYRVRSVAGGSPTWSLESGKGTGPDLYELKHETSGRIARLRVPGVVERMRDDASPFAGTIAATFGAKSSFGDERTVYGPRVERLSERLPSRSAPSKSPKAKKVAARPEPVEPAPRVAAPEPVDLAEALETARAHGRAVVQLGQVYFDAPPGRGSPTLEAFRTVLASALGALRERPVVERRAFVDETKQAYRDAAALALSVQGEGWREGGEALLRRGTHAQVFTEDLDRAFKVLDVPRHYVLESPVASTEAPAVPAPPPAPAPPPGRQETEHQRRRRERAERQAARLEREAEGKWQSARAETQHIPMGQPILVGHHSERRHRKTLERSHRKMGKAVEASEAAKAAKWSAQSAGYAISSDDPDAIPALEARLAELEASRALSKAINAAYRKGGWAAVEQVPAATPAIVARARRTLELAPWMKLPMDLTNLGANIRRVKQRIEALEAAAERTAAAPIEGDGFAIEEDVDDNRIRFTFDARPDKETITKMKREGFRWSRTHGAWQRQLNNAGRHAARRVAKELFGWEPTASAEVPAVETTEEQKRQAEWQARTKAEHERTLERQKSLPAGSPRGGPGPESSDDLRRRANITTEDRKTYAADVIEEAEAGGMRPERVLELREMSRREEADMGRKLRAAARAEEQSSARPSAPRSEVALARVAELLDPLTSGTREAGTRQIRFDGPALASEHRTPDAKALRAALVELLRVAKECPTKAARNRLRQAVSAHLAASRRHANRLAQRFGAGSDELSDARAVRDLLEEARARLAEGT